jgi:hypothetical protein
MQRSTVCKHPRRPPQVNAVHALYHRSNWWLPCSKPLPSPICPNVPAVYALYGGVNSQFAVPHLSWNEARVLSMSSFHGRGCFNTGMSLGDIYAELAAAKAFLGLMIEITFIATFTQRFFARCARLPIGRSPVVDHDVLARSAPWKAMIPLGAHDPHDRSRPGLR